MKALSKTQSSASFGVVVMAYFWAVTSATIVFVIAADVWNFDALLRMSFQDLGAFGALNAIIGIVFWCFAFVAAAIPVLIIYKIGKKLKSGKLMFYAASGAILGLSCVPCYLSLPPPAWIAEDPPFAERFFRGSFMFVLAGIAGALAFWFKADRSAQRSSD